MAEEMTEFEKMRAGLPYRNPDAEIFERQSQAAIMNRKINETEGTGGDPTSRREMLREALGAFGESFFNPPIRWEYGKHIFVGDLSLINSNCTFMDGADIRIGNQTLIAPNVMFVTAGHPVIYEDRYIFDEDTGAFETVYAICKPITVGDGCWIGAGSIILGGVTIGDGTTIGAGSVVTKSIPSRVVAAGNPARIIRDLPGA